MAAVGSHVPTLLELEHLRTEIRIEEWLRLLPTAWACAEPDDTDRAWVDLFTEAREANGGRMLLAAYTTEGDTQRGDCRITGTIEPVSPPWADDEWLEIHRGMQHRDARGLGLAWTTDVATAEMFAVRQSWATGWVASGRVRVRDVLCANHLLGESEVDVDPLLVEIVQWRNVSLWDALRG